MKEKEGMLVSSIELGGEGEGGGGEIVYSTGPPPALPGLEQNFWEGPQWDALGFFVQYMWAFGIVFGVTLSNLYSFSFRQQIFCGNGCAQVMDLTWVTALDIENKVLELIGFVFSCCSATIINIILLRCTK